MKKIILVLIVLICSAPGLMSQWISQPCPTTNILTGLKFVNANTAFAVGWNETIIKTTNAGTNWFIQNEITNGDDFNSLSFVNENTGYAVGGSVGGNNYHGVIYKTTNGGSIWLTIASDSICYRGVWFLNVNTGFIGGWPRHSTYPSLWKTTNGGNNWISLTVSGLMDINKFYFIDLNTGWAVGDTLNGYGTVLKTTNGGNNWSIISSSGNPTQYFSLYFLNANTGWIAGIQLSPTWRGLVRKTTNGGVTWVQQDNMNFNELYQIYFVNENTGWVVGDNMGGAPIQKTTNGGTNWFRQFSENLAWGVDIYMANVNTGWIVGQGGIRKTTTGGDLSISGNIKYSDNNQSATNGYVKAFKLDRTTGNIITFDSTQIQSDGSYILSNVPQDSLDIGVYPNSTTNNDWVITYYPSTTYWQGATTLYPTGNLTNINISVFRMFSPTLNNSANGKIMRIINNTVEGIKDAVVYAKSGNMFVRCAMSDGNGVYHLPSLPEGNIKIIVNRLGYINDSTTVNMTSTSNIDSINFYLNRVNVGIKQISTTVPSEYKLYQNYPNPFNPSTIIRYQITPLTPPFGKGGTGGFVTLKVYDILGKEVATLVNNKQIPGVYEVTWEASQYPSGIYFYRLVSRDFSETKKMLMIK